MLYTVHDPSYTGGRQNSIIEFVNSQRLQRGIRHIESTHTWLLLRRVPALPSPFEIEHPIVPLMQRKESPETSDGCLTTCHDAQDASRNTVENADHYQGRTDTGTGRSPPEDPDQMTPVEQELVLKHRELNMANLYIMINRSRALQEPPRAPLNSVLPINWLRGRGHWHSQPGDPNTSQFQDLLRRRFRSLQDVETRE